MARHLWIPLVLGAGVVHPAGAQVPTDTLRIRTDGPAPAVQLVEELRVGSLTGPPHLTFGWISDIAVTRDGNLYVADSQVPAIRRFGADGSYLGDVGREGQGPGEYRRLEHLALTPDDDLVVWDHTNARISYFSGADGAFLRSFQAPVGSIMGGSGGLHASVRDTVRTRSTMRRGTDERGVPDVQVAWLVWTGEGRFVDSVFAPPRALEGSLSAFRTVTDSKLAPDGSLVTGRTDAYAFHRPLSDGRVLRIEREVAPVPLSGDERRQWEAYREEWETRRGRAAGELPDRKPPWSTFFVDADGRLWVRIHVAAEHRPDHQTRAAANAGWPNVEWVEPTVYEILDQDGRVLGAVTFPNDAEVRAARGSHVWALERGPYDEQSVVRYRWSRR